jgi:hypothetical protein
MLRLAGSGQLHADDLVWRPGVVEWEAAGKVPGLLAPPKIPEEIDRAVRVARQGAIAQANEGRDNDAPTETTELETVREAGDKGREKDDTKAQGAVDDAASSSATNDSVPSVLGGLLGRVWRWFMKTESDYKNH